MSEAMTKKQFVEATLKMQAERKDKKKNAERDIQSYMVLNALKVAKYRRSFPSNRGRHS
jgi:hypothetical protein